MDAAVKVEDRLLRLVPGWESRASVLSAEEGFLLSRIDGTTSWKTLRTIAGLPVEKVDLCVERWLAEGLLIAQADPQDPPAGRVDESLDLPVDLQEEILEFERGLDRPYHQLLGVAHDADGRTIKRAYFQLSRRYHPDRYFRRELGHFADRLDRIFKRVALAYELLMDPATRAELERSFAAAPRSEAAAPPPPTKPGGGYRKPTRREMLEKLRRQFRMPEEVLQERRFRARQLHESARAARHQGNWIEAASCIRLAIAFDPWTDDYKDDFSEIQAHASRLKAERLVEEAASGMLDESSRKEALALLEEAIAYRPADAALLGKAAEIALGCDEPEQAREFAESACEIEPESALHHLVLGRVLRRLGLRDRARRALQRARELDPSNELVQEELKRLRKNPGRQGGKR